jgi:hypothetical protein
VTFSGQPNNIIVGNVFSGWYGVSVEGGSPSLFDFSSPKYPTTNFSAPYDAKLIGDSGDGTNSLIAAARKIQSSLNPSFSSNVTGKLYFEDGAELMGVCHGFGRDSTTYYNGFSFYNAPYSPGYFTPPFGEEISINQYNQDGIGALSEGYCNSVSLTEYNELYGINSIVSKEANLTANDLVAGSFSLLATSKAACPEDAVSTFFEEVQFHPIKGTTTQLGASNVLNSNSVPTSLDNYEIRLASRYSIFSSGTPPQNYLNYVNGKPVASYNADSQQNKLNNTLCMASLLETQTNMGIGTNGIQLLVVPDAEYGAVGSQASFIGADPFNLWHFNFKENSESFPFSDGFSTSVGVVHIMGSQEGTSLFDSTLAIEDNYWVNRQCPATVDYLPWTFGASIYACPSQHFDVPFYAATNKFGFYGIRFLNNCASLNLDYDWNGVKNSSEIQSSLNPYEPLDMGLTEPEDVDSYSGGSSAEYDTLLAIAKQESAFSDIYALNKAYFIWSNNCFITGMSEYQILSGNYDRFPYLYNSLITPYNELFGNDISGVFKYQPNLVQTNSGVLVATNWTNDILLTNDLYSDFQHKLNKILTGQDISLWSSIENQYSFYVSNGQGGVNENFYTEMATGRDARLLTRYLNNTVHGNPIDLFPLNKIMFSFDKASDYLTHTGWGRSVSSFGLKSSVPDIERRYFQGAYSNGANITGLTTVLNSLSSINNSSFYPGFFNDISINKDLPNPTYVPVESGTILDENNRSYSPNGWLALGYNGIGKLDAGFSCFTPIFVQQPLDEVYCKIGQAPTLRTYAVDYHTIPDDKLSARYMEIFYWAQKLKLLDSKGKSLYPMGYKWYRVPTSQTGQFLLHGDFSVASPSSETGSWGCIEGDTKNCTICHPLDSFPQGLLGSSEAYTFIKGAIGGVDDKYSYYCLASGRFGIRISEPSQLYIENWVKFDVSLKNGINVPANLGIRFQVNDYLGKTGQVVFSSVAAPAYNGYQRDPYALVESQVMQQIPPPNAGYGDVSSIAPIGPIGYIGSLRSYVPSYLNDTRGLYEVWGKFLDYGTLVTISKTLSQKEGDLLYGYSHLPICSNYEMANGQAGVQIIPTLNGNKILHWSLNQKAVASYQQTYIGVPWQQLNTFGALYPPINNDHGWTPWNNGSYSSFGIGQWQWYNNLGAIKRFGYKSDYSTNDIQLVGNGSPSSNDAGGYNTQIALIKKQLITPSVLAGVNCGYTPYGFGHNMIFYIEAFDRFYLYCDPMKKKNVQNLNYMNPGIRMGNSAIQYSWLGQPSNTYLERRPMYGPYAYQWMTRRHNRDRNGNGISQGFYSMGWESKYTEMYDAPAIYGLYPKTMDSPTSIQRAMNLLTLRKNAGFGADITIRNVRFGTTNGEGTSRPYGNLMVNCDTTNAMCDYYSALSSYAATHDWENYSCSQANLAKGNCFDPCVSIRYAQGFFPGGKSQNMFGNGGNNKNVRLVAMANGLNPSLSDEVSEVDKTITFRSPLNTPHSVMSRKNGKKPIGISSCKDGGSDHCSYTVPTVHLGTSSWLEGATTSFYSLINLMESAV